MTSPSSRTVLLRIVNSIYREDRGIAGLRLVDYVSLSGRGLSRRLSIFLNFVTFRWNLLRIREVRYSRISSENRTSVDPVKYSAPVCVVKTKVHEAVGEAIDRRTANSQSYLMFDPFIADLQFRRFGKRHAKRLVTISSFFSPLYVVTHRKSRPKSINDLRASNLQTSIHLHFCHHIVILRGRCAFSQMRLDNGLVFLES